jgi:hypothetical protein
MCDIFFLQHVGACEKKTTGVKTRSLCVIGDGTIVKPLRIILRVDGRHHNTDVRTDHKLKIDNDVQSLSFDRWPGGDRWTRKRRYKKIKMKIKRVGTSELRRNINRTRE